MSQFTPVRVPRTFEEVVSQVRDRLASGELSPGERLPAEREFARQLNVSRSALREGLRTLEIAGIVELRKGRSGGAFIKRGNPQAVADSMADLLRLGRISWGDFTEARIWITEIIVRVACERATLDDYEELESNIAETIRLLERGEGMLKTEALIEFHNILARATRNPVLEMMAGSLTDMLRHFAKRLGPNSTRAVFRSRRRFMTAFMARDAEAAVKEMEQNLIRVHRLYLRLARSRAQAQ